jgi:signal peptidase II
VRPLRRKRQRPRRNEELLLNTDASDAPSTPARAEPDAVAWLTLSFFLIVLDQLTKLVAVERLDYERPVAFIDGFWNWHLTHNRGAAFSFLADAGGWQHWLFVALAVGITIALTLILRRTPRADWRTAFPFALIVAGAIGNVIDRIRFGYVVDFVEWYWRDFHWPVFNVADSCIVVGAVLMVWFSLRHPAGRKLP